MRVVVGMSGGVDSSVAAYLLRQQGHEVIGVFMNNWEETDEDGVCTAGSDWADVRRVCQGLGIPYYSVNFARQYRENVFEYFLAEYRRNRTPNPDVLCNREIKFKAFLDYALSLGADKIATGHFAGTDCADGKYRLLRAKDENKDQTYFLYMLNQRALSRALFPVAGLCKAEVRQIARDAGIPVSEKKDSTGVCFIGERNFREFLKGYLPSTPGDIVTADGKTVGRHEGLMYYTLGQRRGLGIGGGGNGQRWFVTGKNVRDNQLIVEQGDDMRALYSVSAVCTEPTWIAEEPPVPFGETFRCRVRLRHRQPLQRAAATPYPDRLEIAFEEKQRAVTPGQAAVLYADQVCLGGATVDRTRGVE